MLTLKAFGALDFRDDACASIPSLLAQPKRAALLAYLILAHSGGFCRRDTLLALFWPDLDDQGGRRALNQALSFLRRHLPERVLTTRGAEEVGVDASLVCSDVGAFEAALAEADWGEAVARYHGELLEGLHAAGAAPFTDWVDRERARLREEAAGAAWKHAADLIARGRLMEAERAGQVALRLVPTDESAVRGFIEALAAGGDRAAALHFYDQFAGVLAQELEVEPAAETRAAVDAVRSGKTRASPPSAGVVDPGPAAGPAPLPSGPASADTPRESLRWARRPGAWAAAVLISLLAAGALYSSFTGEPDPGLIPDLVVVPPFENLTGDPQLDALGVDAGLWVEDAIRQVGGVQLVPSSFAREYAVEAGLAGSPNPVRAAAQRSRARWAVSGSYRARADSLEFRAGIIDLAHPRTTQSVVETGASDRIGETLDRLARRVSGALAYEFDPWMGEIESGPEPLPSPPTLEAFREHRLGYEAYNRQDWAASFRHHMAAYALDTTLVRALVAAAFMTDDYTLRDSLAGLAAERRHRLSRSGRLDLQVLEANLAGDLERGYRTIREQARIEGEGFMRVLVAYFALRLNRPREALASTERYDPELEWRRDEAWYYWRYRTQALHMLGRFTEEEAEARQGCGRYPNNLELLVAETRALAALGRTEEVGDRLRRSRALPHGHGRVAVVAASELRAHGYLEVSKEIANQAAEAISGGSAAEALDATDRLHLAQALYGAGRWEEALEAANGLLRDSPDDLAALGLVGASGARLGDFSLASGVMDRLSATPRRNAPGEHLYLMACIAAVMGREDEAVDLLYRAYGAGLHHSLRLHSDMDLESLRGREDFQALVKPKG